MDNTVIGTADFATLTESVTEPGTTLEVNNVAILFEVIVDGTEEFADTDSTIVISTTGTLELGSGPTSIALTNIMTLDDVVIAINDSQDTTGIFAQTVLNSTTSMYFLRLTKDNVVDTTTLTIDVSSTASILTDLGLTSGPNVINLPSAASQVNDTILTGSVAGTSPYNLQIDFANGVYVVDGTSLTSFGLSETVDLTTNTINITAHGFTTGDQVTLTSPGDLPTPLSAFPTSLYYIILVDANSFMLATSPSTALTGTAIDLTVQGNDYFTVTETTDAEMYFQVWKGYSDNTVFKQRMDQVIAYFEDKEYIIYRQTNPSTETTFQWVLKW